MELYLAGESQIEIAKILGCSESNIYYHCTNALNYLRSRVGNKDKITLRQSGIVRSRASKRMAANAWQSNARE